MTYSSSGGSSAIDPSEIDRSLPVVQSLGFEDWPAGRGFDGWGPMCILKLSRLALNQGGPKTARFRAREGMAIANQLGLRLKQCHGLVALGLDPFVMFVAHMDQRST